ncbi:hypothetical protein [Pseudaquabacterium terrae]|uniref:hypothetical protein n=1 Tax=Pseudaquabacterium terrae TaxID=2732868 RepID=UPI001FEC44AE|nr:hypothetical protein [Aquabacterium terrae]
MPIKISEARPIHLVLAVAQIHKRGMPSDRGVAAHDFDEVGVGSDGTLRKQGALIHVATGTRSLVARPSLRRLPALHNACQGVTFHEGGVDR